MTEDQKRAAIHEFFIVPQPLLDKKAIAIGIGLFLAGVLLVVQGFGTFGSSLMGVGALWALFVPIGKKAKHDEPMNEVQFFSLARYSPAKARFEARPSVQQMLIWLREDIASAEKESRSQLNLVETTREAITVVGPIFHDIHGISDALILRRSVGEDYFYSTHRLSIFHFTEDFLGSYRANYNMIKDVTTSEETDEFFYRDIVSVRTHTSASNYTLKTGKKLVHSKEFSLAVSSGDKVSVLLNDPEIRTRKEIELSSDDAVNNIRVMLRQFKKVPQPAM